MNFIELSRRQISTLQAVGVFVCLVASVVMFGWCTKSTFLIMISPHFVPMQFNTAFSFMLLGLAFIFLSKNQKKLVVIFSATSGLLCLLTLLEYAFQVNLRIDELFVEGYIMLRTSHPGRMAINTAICFVLSSLAILIYSNPPRLLRGTSLTVCGILISIVLGISVTALLGYCAGFQIGYTWGMVTGMAIHTSVLFILLCVGLLVLIGSRTRHLPVILTLVIGLIMSNQVYVALKFFDAQQISTQLEDNLEELSTTVSRNINSKIDYLNALHAFYDSSELVSRSEFKTFTLSMLERDPNLKALEWIPKVMSEEREKFEAQAIEDEMTNFRFLDLESDGSFVGAKVKEIYFPVYYLEPLKENEIILGFDFAGHADHYRNLMRSCEDESAHIAGPVHLVQDPKKESAFFVIQPYFNHTLARQGQGSCDLKRLKGFFLAILDLDTVIRNVVQLPRFKSLQINIFRNSSDIESDATLQSLIFHHLEEDSRSKDFFSILKHLNIEKSNLNAQKTIKIGEDEWSFIVSATPAFLEKVQSKLPAQAALVAIIFCILLTFYVNDLVKRSGVISNLVEQRTSQLARATDSLKEEIENHQKLEAAIRSSESRFRAITDAIPGGVYQYQLKPNGEQKFLFLSKGAEEIFGLSSEQMLRDFDAVWSLLDPSGVEVLVKSIQESATTLKPWKHEFKIKLRSGSVKWIRGNSIPEAVKPDGSIVWNGLFVDVTDKKLSEEKEKELVQKASRTAEAHWRKTVELEEANKNLEKIQQASLNIMEDLERQRKQLERQSLELEEQSKKADEANKTKSQFLANMSHEIRTPLNAIVGFSELLKDSNLELQQRDYVNTIRESSDLLLALINDILDISKIEAGQIKLETIDFNFQSLIENVLKMMWGRIRHGGVELSYEFKANTPKNFKGDPTRIRQILINLVGNAVKFTEKGEVKIYAQIDQEERAVGPNSTKLRVEVRDTGIGIPKDKLDVIFQHFTQVDLTTTRKYGGTGLGLSISKALVEMMGGRIWVESQLGKGSQFIFTLELKNPERHSEKAIPEVPSELANKEIFIIDDNEVAQKIIRTYIEDLGFKSAGIMSSGVRAIEWLKNANKLPDVVICDVMMPEMGGMEFANAIRKDSRLKKIKLIAITANAAAGIAKECTEVGFQEFLPKPIIRGDLLQAISRALGFDSQKNLDGKQTAKSDIPKAVYQKLRILVAEDNPINRKLMEQILKGIGCQYDFASNGKEAVEKIRHNPYSLVFMDLQMPEMGGIEAAQVIRKEISQSVPIIALTAAAMKEDQELSFKAGMNDYAAKPVNPKRLIELIYEWCVMNQTQNKGVL